ncbi:MAG: hypothetical protein ACR2HQ_12980 [Ilumatobacteraceae bacterium]
MGRSPRTVRSPSPRSPSPHLPTTEQELTAFVQSARQDAKPFGGS